MKKEEILEYFKDINHVYNDCTRYDTLKHMIDELQVPEQKWTPVSERLPDEKWVLGYINNIHDGIDAPHMWVVKIKKGISKKERARLEKLKDPRAHVFYYCDEWGNNLVPYAWDTWGPGDYFGQEVVAWCELPEPYKADEEVNK